MAIPGWFLRCFYLLVELFQNDQSSNFLALYAQFQSEHNVIHIQSRKANYGYCYSYDNIHSHRNNYGEIKCISNMTIYHTLSDVS